MEPWLGVVRHCIEGHVREIIVFFLIISKFVREEGINKWEQVKDFLAHFGSGGSNRFIAVGVLTKMTMFDVFVQFMCSSMSFNLLDCGEESTTVKPGSAPWAYLARIILELVNNRADDR